MFEVGKKYRNTDHGDIWTCVAVDGTSGWLKLPNRGGCIVEWSPMWQEVKEPRTITRYMVVIDYCGNLTTESYLFATETGAIRATRNFPSAMKTKIVPITYTEETNV
jgi:hypothetical protein